MRRNKSMEAIVFRGLEGVIVAKSSTSIRICFRFFPFSSWRRSMLRPFERAISRNRKNVNAHGESFSQFASMRRSSIAVGEEYADLEWESDTRIRNELMQWKVVCLIKIVALDFNKMEIVTSLRMKCGRVKAEKVWLFVAILMSIFIRKKPTRQNSFLC